MDIEWVCKPNQHKGFHGLQCECCSGGKNGLRRRRRAPKYMLRALAHGKKVHHYPFPHYSWVENDEYNRYIPGLSSWKKTLKRRPIDNLW